MKFQPGRRMLSEQSKQTRKYQMHTISYLTALVIIQDHREGLDRAGAQPNAFLSLEHDRSTSHTSGVYG